MPFMDIEKNVLAWFDDAPDSYRSWEYCYTFFRQHKHSLTDQQDSAALHLGFFLASWGMYRPSSFLFKYPYTIHRPVIDCLAKSCFSRLWESEFGAEADHDDLVPSILDLIGDVRKAYQRPAEAVRKLPTATLVTKVMLGTLGCLPACDENFVRGFKKMGFKYGTPKTQPKEQFIKQVLCFSRQQLDSLRAVQERIRKEHEQFYPLMKLVDMYFHQIGKKEPKAKQHGTVRRG